MVRDLRKVAELCPFFVGNPERDRAEQRPTNPTKMNRGNGSQAEVYMRLSPLTLIT